MNGFGSIRGQDRPIRTITRFLEKQTIPHAMLFTGAEGVGKRMTAMAFAMAANCRGQDRPVAGSPESTDQKFDEKAESFQLNACGICLSCKKILSKNHPDVTCIEPDGSMIKINQIRELCRSLILKPYEARIRVAVIADGHTMNPSAANALLKVLEEPPDRTVLIVTARGCADLLPTIVSRCRNIRFNPISREDIEALLVQNAGIHPDRVTIPAAMANGSYARALEMSRPDWNRKRRWLIEAGGLNDPEALSQRPGSLLLAFSEKLAKNKSGVMDALEVMKTWLRDLLVYRYAPEKIIHKDLCREIAHISATCTTAGLIRKIEIISRTQKEIEGKMNLRLSLDSMMLGLASI